MADRPPTLLITVQKPMATVWLCHTKLTPKYRQYVAEAAAIQQVYHLRSPQAIADFLQAIARSSHLEGG